MFLTEPRGFTDSTKKHTKKANVIFKTKIMQRIFYSAITLLLIAFTGCSPSTFQKTKDGVVVNISQNNNPPSHKVKLQVVNDKIIRVSATADKKFSTEKSLMILPGLSFSDKFSVTDEEAFVVLSTDSLNVHVNKQTGEIAFFDKKGNTFLAENKGGGKSFSPIEVEGTKGSQIITKCSHYSVGNNDEYGLYQFNNNKYQLLLYSK